MRVFEINHRTVTHDVFDVFVGGNADDELPFDTTGEWVASFLSREDAEKFKAEKEKAYL